MKSVIFVHGKAQFPWYYSHIKAVLESKWKQNAL